MELSENHPCQTLDPGQLAKMVLDGTETCKKLFSVNNTSQLLQACHSEKGFSGITATSKTTLTVTQTQMLMNMTGFKSGTPH